MVEPERIRNLNHLQANTHAAYVLYWMQSSQRANENPALWYATSEADRLGLPLLVLFVLGDFPEARSVHFAWMLTGLSQTAANFQDAGLAFSIQKGDPAEIVARMGAEAAVIICDASPHRWARSARVRLTAASSVPVVEVDGDSVVPLRSASPKQEWSARTLRPRISSALGVYLDQPRLGLRAPRISGRSLGIPSESRLLAAATASDSQIPGRVPLGSSVMDGKPPGLPVSGPRAAETRLASFVETGLDSYDSGRNDPNLSATSGLSPYLHFGQISALAVARAAREHGGPGLPAFLEQLVVRRELCRNFAYYRPDDYDRWAALPNWASTTLAEHADDPREYVYDISAFEAAATHDPYWNAAQNQLIATGSMHNYMRMYWGKMILAWSRHPQEAFGIALSLNDRLALDGRDPNGWAGVAWCFGLHDRPWPRRKVFGTVRAMSSAGLRRKFDVEAYAHKWNPRPAGKP